MRVITGTHLTLHPQLGSLSHNELSTWWLLQDSHIRRTFDFHVEDLLQGRTAGHLTLEVPGVLLCDERDGQAGAGVRHLHAVPPVIGEGTLAQEEEGVSPLPADDLRAQLVDCAGQPGRVAQVNLHRSLVITKLGLRVLIDRVRGRVFITVVVTVQIHAVVIIDIFIISLLIIIVIIS